MGIDFSVGWGYNDAIITILERMIPHEYFHACGYSASQGRIAA